MSFEFDLNAILGQIGRDKGIDRAVLIEAIESAMLSAARKHYGHNLNLETRFNDESGEIEVLEFKTVVDKIEDDACGEEEQERYLEEDIPSQQGVLVQKSFAP